MAYAIYCDPVSQVDFVTLSDRTMNAMNISNSL